MHRFVHPLACACVGCLFIASGALEHDEHQPHVHAETHEDARRGPANDVAAASTDYSIASAEP